MHQGLRALVFAGGVAVLSSTAFAGVSTLTSVSGDSQVAVGYEVFFKIKGTGKCKLAYEVTGPDGQVETVDLGVKSFPLSYFHTAELVGQYKLRAFTIASSEAPDCAGGQQKFYYFDGFEGAECPDGWSTSHFDEHTGEIACFPYAIQISCTGKNEYFSEINPPNVCELGCDDVAH